MSPTANWTPFAVIAVGFLGSLIWYPDLPAAAPLARWLIALALPTAATITYLILRGLWAEATTDRGSETDRFAEVIHKTIALYVVLFITAIHMLVLLNLTGAEWLRSVGSRLVVALFGGVLIAIGNLLPRTRPNLAIGIRTARTLADRSLWIRLHRTCGRVAVVFGAVLMISGLSVNASMLGVIVGVAGPASIVWLAMSYRRESHV